MPSSKSRRRRRKREAEDAALNEDQQLARDVENFELQRREAEKERADAAALEADINASAGVRCNEDNANNQPVAFVKNLNFNVKAVALVDFFEQELRRRFGSNPAGLAWPPILRCEIKINDRGPHAGRSRGLALVTFADKAYFDHLLDRATGGTLVLSGRTMGFNENKGAVLPARSVDDHSFLIHSFAIGVPPALNTLDYPLKWESEQDASTAVLEFQGADSRTMAVEFRASPPGKKAHRIEIKLRHMMAARMHLTHARERVLVLTFDHPPICFVEENSNRYEDDDDNEKGLSANIMHIRQLMRGLLGSTGFLWELGTGTRSWVRTHDPCMTGPGDGSFGQSLVYHFNLGRLSERTDQKIFACFREFKLKVKDAAIPYNALRDPGVMSWGGGHEDIFGVLPFPIRYMIHALTSSNRLWFYDKPTAMRLSTVLTKISLTLAEVILEELYSRRPVRDPVQWVLREISNTDLNDVPHSSSWDDDNMIRRVSKPEYDMGNRIIRENIAYKERFIRVSFCDEYFDSVFKVTSSPTIVEERIRKIMSDGMIVGGRNYVFLAYSNSQLREQGCWFYDETSHGGFSTSNPTVNVPASSVMELKDVERGNYVFSDGVGMISADLAERVAGKLDILGDPPSAFQIRFKGCKGVVSVAPKGCLPRSKHLALRPSMIKFEGNAAHNNLEVLSVSKPIKCYMNRQLITLLSALGVKDHVFETFLRDMTNELDGAMEGNEPAKLLLARHGGSSEALAILRAGFDIMADPLLRGVIHVTRNRLLYNVQTKARILIPNAISLLGIMDEANVLRPGQVFFQFKDDEDMLIKRPVGSRVVVYRNPSLHPGDIRVLTVADPPELRHLTNVIVFPQAGARPHPNEMSGGPSAHHRAVTIDDIKRFFVDYMINDNLGRIANIHLATADKFGAISDRCLQLAELHSTAVDFSKTGVPARMDSKLNLDAYPHFMEPFKEDTYVSKKILGRLYDSSMGHVFRAPPRAKLGTGFDSSLLIPRHEEFINEASHLCYYYGWDLWEIMQRHGVRDEADIICGFTPLRPGESGRMREQRQERLQAAVDALRRSYRDMFWEEFLRESQRAADVDFEGAEGYGILAKASAWYRVTYQQACDDGWQPLLSFAWIPCRALCELKRRVSLSEGRDPLRGVQRR
ncbi:hypothetical protein HK101_008933 [Irineochytrium annulatum]|nr:hypothetical protein HK101_008933 [Irineochytrium annulatum]